MICSKSKLYQLFTLGRFEEALDGVQCALVNNQNDGRLWELRGFIHSQRHQWHLARHALETATTLVPLSAAGRVYLAECYRQTGLTDLARELACEMLGDAHIGSSLFLAVAALLDRVGCTRQAVEICQNAIEADPQWAQAWYDLAFYLAKCQPDSGLIEHASRQAVRLDPTKLTFRLVYACRLASQERIEEAYELVCELDQPAINSVCCAGCLRKLQAIYEFIGDEMRAAMCSHVQLKKTSHR